MANPYNVLELNPGEDVKVAYRRMALKTHPDTSGLPKEISEAKFREIQDAYKKLQDPGINEYYAKQFERERLDKKIREDELRRMEQEIEDENVSEKPQQTYQSSRYRPSNFLAKEPAKTLHNELKQNQAIRNFVKGFLTKEVINAFYKRQEIEAVDAQESLDRLLTQWSLFEGEDRSELNAKILKIYDQNPEIFRGYGNFLEVMKNENSGVTQETSNEVQFTKENIVSNNVIHQDFQGTQSASGNQRDAA